MRQILKTGLFFLAVMAFWMKGWWNNQLPLTPREENIPQLADIHSLKTAAKQKVLWSAWNPLDNCGTPNITQRSYLLFAPLAQISFSSKISINTIYKIAALIAFILSGIGMYQLLKTLGLSNYSGVIGGLAYMLSPPHITLSSDLLDFNYFWAIIPWILYIIELYISNNKVLFYAGQLGATLALGLILGNTYFVTIAPFIAAYCLLRLIISGKKPKEILFLSLATISFFITLSAFFTLPSLIEAPYTRLSQEVLRKQVIDIPSLQNIIKLFGIRWQKHDPLSWSMNSRYPDISWYFGSVIFILSFLNLINLRKHWKKLFPFLLLSLTIIPFFFIMKIPSLKQIALSLLSFIPRAQSIFDRTYRLFLIPSLALAYFAAFGSEKLFLRQNKHKRLIALALILGILIDFYPLHKYFFSASSKKLTPSQQILKTINSDTTIYRYWSPFTYARHLPKYRSEFSTSYINYPRVNSEYSYTAMSPRFTSEIFEAGLFGAIENTRQQSNLDKITTFLNWGATKYILFHKNIFDYENIIKDLEKKNWSVTNQDDNFYLLVNQDPSFIHLYTNFQPVTYENSTELDYWYQKSKSNMNLYEGEVDISSSINENNAPKLTKWNRSSSSTIEATISTDKPALVVASESWYPGWQVYIDNNQAPLLRANYAFLGTIASAGQHQIVFSYKTPWYYNIGKLVSLLSLLLLVYLVKKEKYQPS